MAGGVECIHRKAPSRLQSAVAVKDCLFNQTQVNVMVHTHLDDETGILTLTLSRAPVNALNEAIYDQLHHSFVIAQKDPSVRAVVLSAVGKKAFCAGADVKEYADLPHKEAEVKQLRFLLRCLIDVVSSPKPVIAAVHAPAIGAGLMLACACLIKPSQLTFWYWAS